MHTFVAQCRVGRAAHMRHLHGAAAGPGAPRRCRAAHAAQLLPAERRISRGPGCAWHPAAPAELCDYYLAWRRTVWTCACHEMQRTSTHCTDQVPEAQQRALPHVLEAFMWGLS